MVVGLEASAASFIAQAGDRVTMAANSQLMIHDAFGVCVGTASDMEAMRDLLDFQSRNIASLYATRTGEGNVADWRDAMRAETWYSAEEAVDAGLADDVAPKARGKRRGMADVEDRWDLTIFKHQGRDQAPTPTIRPANRHAPAAGDTIPTGGPGSGEDETPGSTNSEPGPAGADATLDPFAELEDELFAGLADEFRDAVDDSFDGYDPDVVRTAITEPAENAPAPPVVTPQVASTAPDHVSLEAFGHALWEALQ
jgi:hypothetical protein